MRKRWLNKLKSILGVLCCMALAGCGPIFPSSEKSTVSIHFPQANQIVSSKTGAMSGFDWNRVCFIVNVTASDLNKPSQATCDVPIGIFRGSVAPGEGISLEVPKGNSRKLEIFTYMRASSTAECPRLVDGFESLDRTKIVRVGEVSSFDTQVPEVTLEVSLSVPASGASIISQYQLPASCDKRPPPGGGASRIANGHIRQQGGSFKVEGSVSGRSNEVMLNGSNFKMRLSRQER